MLVLTNSIGLLPKMTYYTVETDLFVVDFKDEYTYLDCLIASKDLGVNLDHYLLEFQLEDDD